MQKFDEIKDSLQTSIDALYNGMDELQASVYDIYHGNPILKHHLAECKLIAIKSLREGLQTNLKMVKRTQMKCAFFGKTSNGKSAVINAMLSKEVLPSCVGRTTSCFVTVEGCKRIDGYFKNKFGSEMHIDKLEDFASELDEEAYGMDSEINVFWPISKCELLQHNVLLLDSPGCDVSEINDFCISKFCLDSDVFVYVVDACSTLCAAERNFFVNVKTKIGNPNIFVLLNKWDLCQMNPDFMKTKQQHIDTIRQFFREDMHSECDSEKRTFFVSATENLEGYTPEFQKFMKSLTWEMTQHAVVTKFRQHSEKGNLVMSTVLDLLNTILNFDKSRVIDNSSMEAKVNTLIENAFKSIKDYSLNEMEVKSRTYCSTIAKNIQQGRSTVDGITTFIESMFSRIFNHLQEEVENILPKITELLESSSSVYVDRTMMRNYIPSSLKELMAKHKTKIDQKKINSSILNAYKELDAYLYPPTPEVTRYTNVPFIDYAIGGFLGLFGGIVNGIAKLGEKVVNAITGTDKQADLENCLKKEINEYLTQNINGIISETRNDISQRIHMNADFFIKDCMEISRLMDKLKNLKIRMEIISEDLALVQVRIESMDS